MPCTVPVSPCPPGTTLDEDDKQYTREEIDECLRSIDRVLGWQHRERWDSLRALFGEAPLLLRYSDVWDVDPRVKYRIFESNIERPSTFFEPAKDAYTGAANTALNSSRTSPDLMQKLSDRLSKMEKAIEDERCKGVCVKDSSRRSLDQFQKMSDRLSKPEQTTRHDRRNGVCLEHERQPIDLIISEEIAKEKRSLILDGLEKPKLSLREVKKGRGNVVRRESVESFASLSAEVHYASPPM